MIQIITLSFLLFWFTIPFATAQDYLKQIHSGVTEKIDGKTYYIHIIRKGQTLYMISKAYGVDVSDIIRENPEVKEGIRDDQKIRIPYYGKRQDEEPKKQVKPNPPPEPKQIGPEPPPEPEVELPCGEGTAKKKEIYQVALMMPFNLNEVPSINTDNPPDDPEAEYKSLEFIQFYEGFRIALDSLKKNGVSVRLFVYDIGKDTASSRKAIREMEMKKMDIIIGLLYQRNFQIVSVFAEKNEIPIVNPITERESSITGNPFVFKVQPSLRTQVDELAEYLSKSYKNENILIIRDVPYMNREEPDKLKKACGDLGVMTQIMASYSASFEHLSKENENVLVVFSENRVFSLELLTKMNEFRNEYKITVIGLPRWDRIEGLEADYLVNLKTCGMAPSFVGYDEQEVKKFVRFFQDTYKTDPEILAFQGFDIAYYFLSALYKFGTGIDRCLSGYSIKSFQTDFQFVSTKGNGFENKHWEIYRYGNYRLERVNTR